MNYSLTWDLETIFPGGAASEKLQERLTALKNEIADFVAQTAALDPEKPETLGAVLQLKEKIDQGISQCASFIGALTAQNVKDEQAKGLYGRLMSFIPLVSAPNTELYKKISDIPETTFQELLTKEPYQTIAFRLTEVRKEGQRQLSEAEEKIISHLAIDGFNGWSEHYDTIVASIVIDVNGEKLSAGQAFNRMMGDPNPTVRKNIFDQWEKVWGEKAELFADTLNHLDGFRLTNYQLHNRKHYLDEALEYNRLQPATLKVMWETIQKNKQPFVDYLTRKAQLLGKEKMEWQDQDAPIILGSLQEKKYSFDEGAAFILQNFRKFSPKMADFAQMAFEKSWIEAEDRPGKRPGGYCTSLPESQESRIFMTYGGSINEVATLAHELGHAFHASVMWDLPNLNQDYAMNVAETASTFAELIVADAALKEAKTAEEKINLIDTKMQNAIAMFMNIHARFIFENNLYQMRQEKVLSPTELTDMMAAAQVEAYAGALATTHPHFWASKLHFYIDDVPFYNFPYTFGYLFSMGIYAFANQKGTSFEDDYIALLRDTAAMTTEELAKKHLGVDLTQPDFWQAGINQVKKDIADFLVLTQDFL
ncbi:M3 family oligoendopeptidase [Enterococcus nangangensis]|uniref:M3 family oligoendopeptidase n=1 Tax=Enterococcus nangangensis TaxID=2559926 RepID=UPI0010FA5CF3|nr:M3 family oligoendopeptidase [Enterococcus nangangensis]